MFRTACLIAMLSLCGVAVVAAASPAQASGAGERQAIEARFERERQDCEARFAVTACLDQAQARHRSALAAWRAEQQALKAGARRQRADDRLAQVESKRSAGQNQAAAAAIVSEAPPAPAQRAAPALAASRPARAERVTIIAQADLQRRAAAGERRRQDAARQRARVEARIAARAAQGTTAAPLPIPEPGKAAAAPRQDAPGGERP